jgi:hypothetical protein
MFFKKKTEEPVFLDCYTYSHYAYNHAQIAPSHKYFPEWFKREAKFLDDGSATIKNCSAFTDFYTKGIVVPLWGEVEITVNPKSEANEKDVYTWVSSNADFDLHSMNHPKRQWQGFGDDDTFNIKFVSPWAFKTTELINFTWTQPTWSQPDTFDNFTALPAVMQFKSQSFTNINYVVKQTAKQQTINLQPLTPMAILHPMTERKVEIRTHLVDREKFEKIMTRAGGMLLNASGNPAAGGGSKSLRSRKERFWSKADELNKCPFQ